MNCRHHKLEDNILRSKSLQNAKLYPRTCYSPHGGAKYDAGFVNIYEVSREEDQVPEDPMLQEVVDPDLGYTLKEVNAMNEMIRDNIEACEKIPDYEETDRVRARKAKEKAEKIQRFQTLDLYNQIQMKISLKLTQAKAHKEQ